MSRTLERDNYPARGPACPFVERNLFRFTERIEIRSTTKLPAGSIPPDLLPVR